MRAWSCGRSATAAQPVAGLPFDEVTGTVPNDRGRVEPGMYVAGWIKRGPTGFIGTNKTCAQETVTQLLDDLDAGTARVPARTGVLELLAERGVEVIDLAGWRPSTARNDVAARPPDVRGPRS